MKILSLVVLTALAIGAPLQKARATMPMLTEKPSSATLKTCLAWAHDQDEESLSMWGVQSKGSSSADISILRLALSCLGEEPPEIVGFGSSSGFDGAYCKTHSNEKICTDR